MLKICSAPITRLQKHATGLGLKAALLLQRFLKSMFAPVHPNFKKSNFEEVVSQASLEFCAILNKLK